MLITYFCVTSQPFTKTAFRVKLFTLLPTSQGHTINHITVRDTAMWMTQGHTINHITVRDTAMWMTQGHTIIHIAVSHRDVVDCVTLGGRHQGEHLDPEGCLRTTTCTCLAYWLSTAVKLEQ